jgi:hypothetical protein
MCDRGWAKLELNPCLKCQWHVYMPTIDLFISLPLEKLLYVTLPELSDSYAWITEDSVAFLRGHFKSLLLKRNVPTPACFYQQLGILGII